MIFMVIFMCLVVVISAIWAVAFCNSIEEGIDDLVSPKIKLPDEITFEIVNEEPKERMKPSISRNIAESVTSGYQEHEGSTSFRSTGKGGYIPE